MFDALTPFELSSLYRKLNRACNKTVEVYGFGSPIDRDMDAVADILHAELTFRLL